MFRRRRPLLRGAAAGAAGYAIGKRAQRRREEEFDQEYAPEPAAEESEAGGSAAISDAQIEELRKLAQLKEEGILTNEEFAAQKEKLLRGS